MTKFWLCCVDNYIGSYSVSRREEASWSWVCHRISSPNACVTSWKVHIAYWSIIQFMWVVTLCLKLFTKIFILCHSKKDADDSMVYSYRHGFSGFAAKLTKSQAKKIAGTRGCLKCHTHLVFAS